VEKEIEDANAIVKQLKMHDLVSTKLKEMLPGYNQTEI